MTLANSQGPQQERTKKLQQQYSFNRNNADLGIPQNREDLVPIDIHGQDIAFQKKIQQLEDDNELLKNYVQRLSSQLKRVLIKHHEYETLENGLYDEKAIGGNEDEGTSPPWFTSPEYVCPLFVAYDGRIKELEYTCEKGRTELSTVRTQIDYLMKENDQLRSDLASAFKKLETKTQTSLLQENWSGDNEEIQELREHVKILQNENALLCENASQSESNGMELSAVNEQLSQYVSKLSKDLGEARNLLQHYKTSSESLGLQKQLCEQKLQHFAAKTAEYECEKEDVEKNLRDLKESYNTLEESKKCLQKIIDDLRKEQGQEEGKWIEKHMKLTKSISEVNTTLESKLIYLVDLEEKYLKTSASLETAQADCQNMMKQIQRMEKRIIEYNAREASLSQLEKDTKLKVYEITLEKDKIQVRENNCRREIARLLECRQEDASKYLKEQEESNQEIRKRLNKQLSQRDEEICRLQKEIANVKFKMEQAQRSQKGSQKELDLTKDQLFELRKSIEPCFDKSLSRIIEAEEDRDKALSREELKSAEIIQLSKAFDNQRSELNEELILVKEKVRCLERELNVKRNEIRDLLQERTERDRQIGMITKDLTELRVDSASSQSHQLMIFQNKSRELTERLHITETELIKIKEDKTKMENLLRSENDRIQSKHRTELDHLNSSYRRLKEEKTRLENENHDLNLKIVKLSSEVSSMEQDLAEAEKDREQLHVMLEESDKKVSDLSAQMSSSIIKQQQLLRSENENRTALERMKLDKRRYEREIQSLKQSVDNFRDQPSIDQPKSFGLPVHVMKMEKMT